MKLLISLTAIVAAWAAFGQGTFEAIEDYDSNNPGQWNGTVGGEFTVTNPVTVTAIGCFDYLFGINTGPIQVGIWNSSGTLLASSTLSSTNTLSNQSRYQAITPLFLDPGQTYSMGACSTNGTIYVYVASPALGGSLLTPGEIVLGDAAQTSSAFPAAPADMPGTPGSMFVGANFQFQDRVPEPSAGPLLGLGGLLLAGCRRWRARTPHA